ncbi:hypothetical protein M408DRAFT_323914 [Serendipita vermifera MAFF 305830]|uniref:Uncharacterized protein n=2 Tax=Serendipita vermifera MAFF 305830 TaxID=933852 RepID=A0A0C2W739_SERVB|nr:hypothetical protein M408DRAFT_323914 [Serendipita vermifera MAFF 305830]
MQADVIRKQVPGWTRTHGHFMIMGGFHLFRLPTEAPTISLPLKSSEPSNFVIPTGDHSRADEVPVCPIKFEDVPVDILKIIAPTETELQDRGKSDVLTKIIVLVQTLWFVIQCIARGSQRLPLTELEVVTLAYATLNFFIYVFWWDKPKNIECPNRVYKPSTTSHEESGREATQWGDTPFRWINRIIQYTLGGQDDYITISEEASIPMFWSGRIEEYLQAYAGIGPSILGSVFGAIHCVAWLSEFPSRPELILWRISCIAMIAVPFMAVILCVVSVVNERMGRKDTWWLSVLGVTSAVLLVLSAWLYIASRIATLVIAFTTLRSLPPAAYTTVDWTTFIPHI